MPPTGTYSSGCLSIRPLAASLGQSKEDRAVLMWDREVNFLTRWSSEPQGTPCTGTSQSVSSSPFFMSPYVASTHHLKHLMSPTAKKNLPSPCRAGANNALVHIVCFTSQQGQHATEKALEELPREVVDCPTLSGFKVSLDKALSNSREVSLPIAGDNL